MIAKRSSGTCTSSAPILPHRRRMIPRMFPKDAWYVASWADDLGTQPLARRICNGPIVLYRDAAGRAGALVDRCCHRGAPLSAGRVTDEGLECGYHGLVFARDGECVRVPGQDRPPKTARVRS